MDFERNRQELLNKIKAMPHKAGSKWADHAFVPKAKPAGEGPEVLKTVAPKINAVLYTFAVLFEKSLISHIGQRGALTVLKQTTEAIDFIADHEIDVAILDMDTPTDSTKCAEIFANVRMLRPQTRFVICGKNPNEAQTEHLLRQGAAFVQKPINTEEFLKLFTGK